MRIACFTRRAAALALLSFGLAGCASLNTLTAEVSTFGEWPQQRKPGSYAFERLPSQQARQAEQQQLEELARPALAKAGFVPVAAGAQSDVVVQLGARLSRSVSSPWDDPLWWHGSTLRVRPWFGPSWSLHAPLYERSRYEREVAVLIRERESGKPLYEARASHDSSVSGNGSTVAALFAAAMMDFPRSGLNPRQVTVSLTTTP